MPRSFGYVPNPRGTERFVSGLKFKSIAETGLKSYSDRDSVLYPAILRCDPKYSRVAQGIGSCVGHGWAGCVDALSSTEIVIHGDAEDWKGRVLEASIYGPSRVEARGIKRAGYSDGSYGAAAAEAVMTIGTLHYGVKYGDQVFDKYSASREKEWGNTGLPDDLEPYAKQRRVKTTTLVRNFEEFCAAVDSGFPVAICSMQGFTMTRDKDGFCVPRRVWPHCMAGIGRRGGKRPGGLIWNSWGMKSNSGPHYSGIEGFAMPSAFVGCTFWCDAHVLDRMLAGEDSFALSSYDGFPPRKLPDWAGGIL
jgi:hypothetical protein